MACQKWISVLARATLGSASATAQARATSGSDRDMNTFMGVLLISDETAWRPCRTIARPFYGSFTVAGRS